MKNLVCSLIVLVGLGMVYFSPLWFQTASQELGIEFNLLHTYAVSGVVLFTSAIYGGFKKFEALNIGW